MRQILLALVILSTFAFAQNVLAISPSPEEDRLAVPATGDGAEVSDALPPTGSMALLLGGLAGLTVAGRRFEERGRA